ncbi:uncharacterized protein C8A04DRAFT_14362 [Dichotomopilus funicola]|uniref:N-acetyltransferase domain-containing protein n=1 Tax=Dichotomopilus funicola TaxID=1934379 RepID=A0AAN6ZKE5_9PEZI|nr:hypothetical protein C8A04DRAFT_14362 [Dichotomopilus funicola]
MTPLRTPQSWTRSITLPPNDHSTTTKGNTTVTYTISTDPALIQPEAVQAAFATDMIYWARPFDEEELRVCLRTSLCLGLYQEDNHDPTKPQQSTNNGATNTQETTPLKKSPATKEMKMIGLSRLITDTVTFAYLTDVYVLPAHQNRGLARWMMACLDQILNSWPNLRRCLLFTSGEGAVRLYEQTLGAREVISGGTGGEGGGLVIMERTGPGKVFA